MKKLKYLFVLLLSVFGYMTLQAQEHQFILLGDTHYDRLENHDFNWIVTEKSGDLRQIEGYTKNSRTNWVAFMKTLKSVIINSEGQMKAILQLGDISEGLAGDSKADQMAAGIVKTIEDTNMPVPWVITKGNHDVTSGTPAKEAFKAHYIPMFQRQLGNPDITSANYSYRVGNCEFFVCDYYEDSSEMLRWLKAAAAESTAKYKFMMVHEPVIPVTERCWHMFRKEGDETKRQELLQTVAENRIIVLAGHLHRYAVVKRSTEWGPVVQLMAGSVISDRNAVTTSKLYTTFSSALATESSYEPATLEKRIAMLDAEAPFVSYYKQCSLQGYGVLKVNEVTGEISFDYYGGLSCTPFDSINVSELMSGSN
ncbi:metallophosphoesterase family protein [Coprobacter sp.]